MKPPDEVLARVRDPLGREVILLARIWHDKILRGHNELTGHFDGVLAAVGDPDRSIPDPQPRRWRYYRRRVGPSRWVRVVVSYEQTPARIITAIPQRKDPPGWKA
jgi:hypothetical protein